MLNPTPLEKLCDVEGRPYFLWDCDVDDAQFRRLVASEDPDTRARWVGKLMRQAKPDDVFYYLTADDLRSLWSRVERYLGRTRAFWRWYLWEAPRRGE